YFRCSGIRKRLLIKGRGVRKIPSIEFVRSKAKSGTSYVFARTYFIDEHAIGVQGRLLLSEQSIAVGQAVHRRRSPGIIRVLPKIFLILGRREIVQLPDVQAVGNSKLIFCRVGGLVVLALVGSQPYLVSCGLIPLLGVRFCNASARCLRLWITFYGSARLR